MQMLSLLYLEKHIINACYKVNKNVFSFLQIHVSFAVFVVLHANSNNNNNKQKRQKQKKMTTFPIKYFIKGKCKFQGAKGV